MKVRPRCLFLIVLWACFLATFSTSGAAEHYDSKSHDEIMSFKRDSSPSIVINHLGPLTTERSNARSPSGSVEVLNVNRDFARQTTLRFRGRNQSNPLTFQRIDFDAPRPQLWRQSMEQENLFTENLINGRNRTTMIGNVPAEWATVWYGEALGLSDRNGTFQNLASFIIDAKGQICGTILDGADSYQISSVVDESGNWRYKFDVVSLEEPSDEWPNDDEKAQDDSSFGSGDNRRLNPGLRGFDMASYDSLSTDNGLTHSRGLQVFPHSRKAILDVAVIYTQTAKIVEGGDAEIHNLIGLSIFQTNMAFVNSGSNIRVRLVKTFEDRSFPDNGSLNGWNALLTYGDGYFDYWEQIQNATGANSVVVIVDSLPRWCGRAQTGGPLAIVARGCSAKAGRYSFAHELGHWFVRVFDCRRLHVSIVAFVNILISLILPFPLFFFVSCY